jgi:flagellar motor switch protein FliN/FliY
MLETDDQAHPLAETGPAGEPASESGEEAPRPGLSAVYDVPLRLSAVLGRANIPVARLLRLGRGAVVELDRKVGEPIDVLVNDRLVARGEVLVVDDRLAVTLTEIVKGNP